MDGSIDIETGWTAWLNFSLFHGDQTGSKAHPASYPMGTRPVFLEGKLKERSLQFTSI
jgi:hypothetical protein